MINYCDPTSKQKNNSPFYQPTKAQRHSYKDDKGKTQIITLFNNLFLYKALII